MTGIALLTPPLLGAISNSVINLAEANWFVELFKIAQVGFGDLVSEESV